MGFCIMFPWFCGLHTVEVAEMKQAVVDISNNLDGFLDTHDDIEERKIFIDESRKAASARLAKKGYKV